MISALGELTSSCLGQAGGTTPISTPAVDCASIYSKFKNGSKAEIYGSEGTEEPLSVEPCGELCVIGIAWIPS